MFICPARFNASDFSHMAFMGGEVVVKFWWPEIFTSIALKLVWLEFN